MQIQSAPRGHCHPNEVALSAAPLSLLRLLEDGYLSVGGPAAPAMLPAVVYPEPHVAMTVNADLCGAGYARAGLPLGSAPRSLRGFDRLVTASPEARCAFERSVGGSILGYSQQGRVMIQSFSPAAFPSSMMGHGNASTLVAGSLARMSAVSPVPAPNAWHGMVAGGLAAVGGCGVPPVLGGAGFGSWNPSAMPGRINNTNPIYESMHQAQVAGVLMDPALTVEDKVTLMIMLIMKKMDRDIERQAQYINSIQQQQSNRGKKGGKKSGSKGLGKVSGGGDSSPSIDVETMKLKRMVDKRGQMFDMLRQIIDKYNETAKGVIQSIGR